MTNRQTSNESKDHRTWVAGLNESLFPAHRILHPHFDSLVSRSSQSHVHRRGRRALTLVEVLLVLALLVIIGAVSVPQLAGSMSRGRLQHSGDLLRSAWGKARLAAMRSGEVYLFRLQPNGGWYQIVTLAELAGDGAANASTPPPDDGDELEFLESDVLRLARHRLPAGIVFASAEIEDAPSLAAEATAGDGNWSNPILFYADGITSNATVLLANDDGYMVRVTLRGLTGMSHAGEIEKGAAP